MHSKYEESVNISSFKRERQLAAKSLERLKAAADRNLGQNEKRRMLCFHRVNNSESGIPNILEKRREAAIPRASLRRRKRETAKRRSEKYI